MKQPKISWPQAKYIATDLVRRRASSDPDSFTHTLQDARVDLNPHQVESALFAFRSPLSGGAILADEVGLGKTIEAGIILSQKWAERKRHLVIIAPANLRKQWVEELEEKFYLPAFILDRKVMDQLLANPEVVNPFETDRIVVCSYDFARRQERYLRLAQLDLVVLDEAHRLRNVYRPDNQTGNILRNALVGKKKILLTATPLQNSLLELYGLTSFIDEYAFGDLKSFKSRYNGNLSEIDYAQLKKRLAPLCHRTLRRQVLEYIRYTSRIPMLHEFFPSAEEAELYNLVTEFLQRDRLVSMRSSQRALTTLVLRKLLASSSYAIGGTLQTIIQRIDAQVAAEDDSLEFADYESWETMMDEIPDAEETWRTEQGSLSPEDLRLLGEERAWLQRCLDLAKRIRSNSKAEQLLIALESGFKKLSELGANRKALIFTESRRTQEFLLRLLSERGYEGEVMTFSGTNNDARSTKILRQWREANRETGLVTGVKEADMRAALVDEFRHRATIMIATEAAAEGINLQFCSLVVNYDLPWNPQRIEQRIGRCHRYGQRHDVVVINFLNKSNAADRRVYELLDEKFRLFDGVFGASDEVLGSISSGTDFEQRIAYIYQTCRTEGEIQAAFDELKAELSPEIDERMQQTRTALLENFDDEVRARLRDSEGNSRRLLRRYEERLWMLTQYILRKKATFSPTDYSFVLREPITDISDTGPYYMLETSAENKSSEMEQHGGVLYRANHPLAQYTITEAKNIEATPTDTLILDYSHSGKRIAPLAELVGQEGYLSVDLLSVETAETIDHWAVAMITEQGEVIPSEVIEHIWSIPSGVELTDTAIPKAFAVQLEQLKSAQIEQITEQAKQEALKLFDEQVDKLDTWAEDMKLGLEREIQDLSQTIRLMKSEARKADSIEARLAAQREIKASEALLKRKRADLFDEHDRIEAQKDLLIDNLEQLLSLRSEKQNLFTLRWRMI
ncbi:helicase SNF2 [Porphyromonas gingivalis]|uniref:SNF2-related protein n=1 Tax=Porphyromonas gingivalis TaxID=837 RepID=UPI000C19720D|nr:SNF2-related protein [Porphyromonas gingivalis]ATR90144.1 helicase SNF2 [Porphyromonas gingivalis]